MKRLIYASSYEKITDAFPVYLLDAVRQFLPKNCHPRFDLRRDKILLQNVPSDDVVKKALIKSCEELNYDTYIFMDGDVETLAAVKGQAYVTLTWFKDDEIHNGFISINLNHGNVLNQDWYEETESATEMPARTKVSKMSATELDAYIKENNLTGEYYARLANLPYTASSGDRAKVRRELVKLDMQLKGVN